MAIKLQHIKNVTPGNAFQIHRKVMNPGRPDPVISATLQILNPSGQPLIDREVRGYQPLDKSVPDEGLVINPGDKQPFVVDFKINIFSDETSKLVKNPYYNIRLNTATQVYNVEVGLFEFGATAKSQDIPVTASGWDAREWDSPVAWDDSLSGSDVIPPSPPPPPNLSPPPSLPLPVPGDAGYPPSCLPAFEVPACVSHAYSTYADACVTVGGRGSLIIDGFLDSVLGDYRMLKVWDEHARRTANDPFKLRLTYEYLNQFTTPEVFDGNNNAIPFDHVDFDFRNGVFSVVGDDGNQDYFVTYTFNFFPETILRMFVQQTVLIMNFVGGGAGGGYITSYTSLEATPPSWDGLIALGAAALAWKRLATHVPLWRNWLVFSGDTGEGIEAPGGAAAQQAANDAATYYQGLFDNYAAATKFDRFVIGPTEAWVMFANTGFGRYGGMGMGTGNQIWEGKLRGLTINKSSQY